MFCHILKKIFALTKPNLLDWTGQAGLVYFISGNKIRNKIYFKFFFFL